jgi:hypothetical protein
VGVRSRSLKVVDGLCIVAAATIAVVCGRGLLFGQLAEVVEVHAHRCTVVVLWRCLSSLYSTACRFVSFPRQLLAVTRAV